MSEPQNFDRWRYHDSSTAAQYRAVASQINRLAREMTTLSKRLDIEYAEADAKENIIILPRRTAS